MATILVTGGAGFVGSCIAARLAEKADNFVVVIDNLVTGTTQKIPTSVHNNIRFIKCNVNNYKSVSAVFYAHRFDYVFHYAALVGVLRTLENPVAVLQDIDGINNVLNLSVYTGVKRVYFSSSSEVYGEPVEFPQNEDTTPLNSRLPYAIVKNVGEAYLKSFEREYGLEYTIFRFFNTYGPKQSKDFVMSKFITSALTNNPITVNGEGKQTRTFCYIDDNVDACVNAFYGNKFVNEVLNVGSDSETEIIELAQMIIKRTNSKSEIIHLPPLQEGDMTRRQPDISKMKKVLNRPMISLEKGIENVLADTSYILD